MMLTIRNKDFVIACPPHERTWQGIAARIAAVSHAGIPIRLILTAVDGDKLCFEGSFIETDRQPVWPSLLRMKLRQSTSRKPFVAVSIIPTGVRADIGGFAGDGTPCTNLLATACDYLITNPNSVTASDLYYANDNILYLEGNLICQLLLGNLAVLPEKRTDIGVIIERPDDERLLHNILNALNGLRTVGGINIKPCVVTGGTVRTECIYSPHGHASGNFAGMDELMLALDTVAASQTTSVGLITTLMVPDQVRQRYYAGETIPNPWGGAEAILTHMTTTLYPFTAAHAPLLTNWEHTMFGKLVDPRDGAELISSAYACSPLRGLTRSPRLMPSDMSAPTGSQRLAAEHISAVVMPATTVGNIPFFASLDQQIPVILVRGNPTQSNITPDRLQIDHQDRAIYYVDNYMEATGLLLALRHGIAPESTRRPCPPLSPIYLDSAAHSG
ncbi:MAG: DUF3326 domain-containing protein [Pseudomonadota bacterium]